MSKKDESDAQLSDDVKDAIAETVAAQRDTIAVELNGHTYEVSLKAFRGMRFRLAMQKGQDMIGLELLLGPLGMSQLIENEGDELDAILRFIQALGEATGSGNS